MLPPNNIKGNGAITIRYKANGEASDWFLGELGVISMSPELGIDSNLANTFFITSKEVLLDVLEQNYDWFWFTVLHLSQKLVTVELLSI